MTTITIPSIQRAKMLDPSPRLLFAVEIAREAGQVITAMSRHASLQIEQKEDGTPVTMADRDAEMFLRQRISERFPDDGILGEEFDALHGSNRYHWVLDPIDGTKSYIHKVPLYTTLVALLEEDKPLLGVIHAPVTNEMLYAQVGKGCWYCQGHSEPSVASVSQITDIREALLLTSDVESFTLDRSIDARAVYDQLAGQCRLARTWGDAYGYLMVATGRAEIMIDPEMSLWDMAALQPIMSEAGGSFTDWQGQANIHAIDSIATNGALAEQVLEITRGW